MYICYLNLSSICDPALLGTEEEPLVEFVFFDVGNFPCCMLGELLLSWDFSEDHPTTLMVAPLPSDWFSFERGNCFTESRSNRAAYRGDRSGDSN